MPNLPDRISWGAFLKVKSKRITDIGTGERIRMRTVKKVWEENDRAGEATNKLGWFRTSLPHPLVDQPPKGAEGLLFRVLPLCSGID
jgi:hypothetical protein